MKHYGKSRHQHGDSPYKTGNSRSSESNDNSKKSKETCRQRSKERPRRTEKQGRENNAGYDNQHNRPCRHSLFFLLRLWRTLVKGIALINGTSLIARTVLIRRAIMPCAILTIARRCIPAIHICPEPILDIIGNFFR